MKISKTGFRYKHIVLGPTDLYLLSYNTFDPVNFNEYLTEQEVERMFSFKSENRRREFVATRLLRHEIFGFSHIQYDSLGAPFIENEGFISISHCKDCVGIAVNKQYKVGVDLETPRNNIKDISHKFLSEQEKLEFDISDKMELTKIWSAKEALYKLAGRKKIIFCTELLLSKESNEMWKGQIINPNHDVYVNLNIFEDNGNVISINSEKVVRKQKHI